MNPFRSLKTETIHTLEGTEVNAYVEQKTGRKIDPVRNGDVCGDDSEGHLVVHVARRRDGLYSLSPGHEKMLKTFIETGVGQPTTIIDILLCELATRGDIPEGTYHIHYTWG